MKDSTEELRQIGRRLRELRQAAGQSQSEAAAGANISRQYLSEAEAGANVTLAVVIRLAHHFGIPTTSIVEVADSELVDEIDVKAAARSASTDPEVRAQIDADLQPLIGEALDRGQTRPLSPPTG